MPSIVVLAATTAALIEQVFHHTSYQAGIVITYIYVLKTLLDTFPSVITVVSTTNTFRRAHHNSHLKSQEHSCQLQRQQEHTQSSQLNVKVRRRLTF